MVKINGGKRRTWFIDSSIDGKSSPLPKAHADFIAGTMLVHHTIDPLFLVIPLVLPLLAAQKETVQFQPLSSLISTVSSLSAHSLSAPFTKPPEGTKVGFNEDVGRLLQLKSVKRVFKLCCERKGNLPPLSYPCRADI